MKPIIILVAGGSASGKTSVVNELLTKLPNNDDVVVISHDDYYNDITNLSMEEKEKINFDHPNSLETSLLIQNLKDLIDNKQVLKPVYDMKTHNRAKEYVKVDPKKIIIVEGILVLAEEELRNLADIKIYVKCDEDLRFIRRLVRDVEERNRTYDSVIKQYLTTVKPMFNQFVRPSSRYADIIIPNDDKHDIAVEFLVSRIKDILNK